MFLDPHRVLLDHKMFYIFWKVWLKRPTNWLCSSTYPPTYLPSCLTPLEKTLWELSYRPLIPTNISGRSQLGPNLFNPKLIGKLSKKRGYSMVRMSESALLSFKQASLTISKCHGLRWVLLKLECKCHCNRNFVPTSSRFTFLNPDCQFISWLALVR